MTKKLTIYDRIENKELWPHGPWKNEPDEKKFEYRGITCLIQRGPMGQLNGYAFFPVSITPDETVNEIGIHGCITFNEVSHDKEYRIIGFDCAHLYDLTPVGLLWKEAETPKRMEKYLPKDPQVRKNVLAAKKRWDSQKTYKDMEFVEKELKSMVDQVLDYKKPPII